MVFYLSGELETFLGCVTLCDDPFVAAKMFKHIYPDVVRPSLAFSCFLDL